MFWARSILRGMPGVTPPLETGMRPPDHTGAARRTRAGDERRSLKASAFPRAVGDYASPRQVAVYSMLGAGNAMPGSAGPASTAPTMKPVAPLMKP